MRISRFDCIRFFFSFFVYTNSGCGQIESIPGSLSSPRYPFAYPNNMNCQWEIEAPQGRYILLEFTAFQLESSCTSDEGCKCNDFITIKDHETGETIQYVKISLWNIVLNIFVRYGCGKDVFWTSFLHYGWLKKRGNIIAFLQDFSHM